MTGENQPEAKVCACGAVNCALCAWDGGYPLESWHDGLEQKDPWQAAILLAKQLAREMPKREAD
jgi:hypothetical protein